MAKWFKIIWAQSGDRATISETLDPSGYVSYEAGYPIAYELVKGTNPAAKSPTRQEFNEVFYEVTGAINQYQTHGFPDYIDAITNGGTAYAYQIGAVVRFTDGNNYINLVASNTAAPDVSGWALFSDFASSISAAASKATPADADSFGITDSAASGIIKKTTWAQIKTALQSIFATLASPTFTGIPAAPTASIGTNTTQLATTAFVKSEIPNQLNAAGAAPIYAARAWVNFNGTGTPTIRTSGNVSSITDNGVGDYTINFTTALPDIDYSIVSNSVDDNDTARFCYEAGTYGLYRTTSACRVRVASASGTTIDSSKVDVVVFR